MHGRATRGFTLMETLVMLVLVSFAVTLMFQMLGNYRIAKERSAAQAGRLDRRALVEAWFLESVEGLYPLREAPLQGTPTGFEGLSLSPLHAAPGAPVPVGWTLERQPGENWLVYREDGSERWRAELRDPGQPAFVFFGADGRRHEQWPPAQGLQEALPAAVALAWDGEAGTPGRLLLASVRHDREPRFAVPFESEVD